MAHKLRPDRNKLLCAATALRKESGVQARFLLGPAGSGKTFRCLAEIRSALQQQSKGPPPYEGRPLVLLAPKQAPENLAPTIAIAWKDTAEAARAVTAAMPLLMKADKVLILAAEESGGSTASLESAKRLVQQMRWHGISAEAHHVSPAGRSVADAIAHIAQERKADLLVMGAYGHSRFRELVLGGVTRDVLRECRLPVLLFH